MSSGAAHRAGAAVVVGGIALYAKKDRDQPTAQPLLAGGLAWLSGTLPDILEPAHHPNHRQFFHSLAFAGIVVHGVYQAWKWEPETDLQKSLRFAGMAVGGAYLVHLAMDSMTPKRLPII